MCLTLTAAADKSTVEKGSIYTNLTETDWKEYFFGNASESENAVPEGRTRSGKDFFDYIGLGTGPETDPYLARANELCLSGDLSECFKSRALASLDDFFTKEGYYVTENVRVVRMPAEQLRRLVSEPYEFSTQPRAEETEWEQFVKFLMRKIERFVKSTALEVKVPDELTEEGRYSPRFVDEIASEIDVLEDKKAPKFTRFKLKRLFIPLLIILKLFKLKLLLFLPMILGIASFKKLLGFLAIVVPGMIGVFKLCKPQLYSTSFGNGHATYYQHQPPQYTPAGVVSGSPQYYSHHVPYQPHYEDRYGYTGYNSNVETGKAAKSGSVAFRDDAQASGSEAHEIAYSGYNSYRQS
ncbi:UNVERIFIED_CONTAM: hypothetical protein PYX00_004774 [Menopon gallinae]|uniref:Osiris 2 n=1 Tax=Menopon gallinae TaxID=328185 RepID=A0AAW2I6U2_9NEOP